MKRIATIFIMILSVSGLFGQDITGQWNGILKVMGTELPLVFNISKTDTGFTSTMDSPKQGAKGIPVTNTTFENLKLTLEISSIGAEYTGTLKDAIIEGTFKQSGQQFPLSLSREKMEIHHAKRPQEPLKPYPYYSEEITFRNTTANVTLAGTLTIPSKEGNYPAVILITGSGLQNRDEEIFEHKPFLVIADYLTRNGIAVLRYDDRGFGESTGNPKDATTFDLALDVESAVAYLKTRKEIDSKKIGLIGHSEGGVIAPIVASELKDVHFIILLAGTGIRGDKLLLMQQEAISKAMGIKGKDLERNRTINKKAFDMVFKCTNSIVLKDSLTISFKENFASFPDSLLPKGMSKDEFIAVQVEQITSPWMQCFIKYNPQTALEKVKCPVLAINGEKDLQVPHKENLKAIKNALKKAGNKNVTIRKYPNMNHLFQECKTGLPDEYAFIEQTFSPIVLEDITQWIKSVLK